jgi:predicted lipoprotein with Yx(FWY)xxD motif
MLAMLAMAAIVLNVGLAHAADVPVPLKTAKAGDLGEILVGPNGMTLYTFANDKEEGKSSCNGSCAVIWPPFHPSAGAPAPTGALSVITRDDGSKQYAYKGKPLYYYKNDEKPGDTTGHKLRDLWFVVQP